MLRLPAAADPAARAEFTREVRSLSGVRHAHLVNGVLEADLDAEEPYVALAEPPDAPLTGYDPHGREARLAYLFPNRVLAEALLQTAQALEALHTAGLFHGNLRPDCLRVSDDRVVLTGCGEPAGSVMDSLAYAPPVDWKGSPRERDLYALAASFFAVVTGQSPNPSNAPEHAKALNPGLSRAMARILDRCMAHDREKRYPDMEALFADLRAFLAIETVLLPPVRRWLTFWIEGSAVLIAGGLIVLLAGWLAGYHPGPHLSLTEAMALYAPSVAYWLLADSLPPRGSWVRRRFVVAELADRGGDPVGLGRRAGRAVIKTGTLTYIGGGVCVSFWVQGTGFLGGEDPGFLGGVLLLLMVPPFTGLLMIAAVVGLDEISSRSLDSPRTAGEPNVETLPRYDIGDRYPLWILHRPADPARRSQSAPREDLETETALARAGSYDLIRVLDAGAMGTVNLAWDRALGRRVAVKLMSDRERLGSRERFEREARLAAQVNHPNVAAVYGAGGWDADPYIAMEYIEGETLKARVERQGPLDIAEAWGYAVQIAEGLEAADRAGIVHRDVKPANVMLDRTGVVKLTDFGVSRSVKGGELTLTQTGAVVGTPLFMAPEQARGEPADRRSDMYALGMTLYYLLTGRTAFSARSREDLLALQLTTDPEPLLGRVAGLNAEQDQLVRRLLARDRDRRFPDYKTLLQHLREEAPESLAVAPASLRLADGWRFFCFAMTLCLWPPALLVLGRHVLYEPSAPLVWKSPLLSNPSYWLGVQAVTAALGAACVVYRPGYARLPTKGFSKKMALHVVLSFFVWPGSQRNVGLRVSRTGGRRISMGRALVRILVDFPVLLPWPVVALGTGVSLGTCLLVALGATLAVAALNGILLRVQPRRRVLGDLVAGTEVLQIRPVPTPGPSAQS
jgi:serine/threonine protein kinase